MSTISLSLFNIHINLEVYFTHQQFLCYHFSHANVCIEDHGSVYLNK